MVRDGEHHGSERFVQVVERVEGTVHQLTIGVSPARRDGVRRKIAAVDRADAVHPIEPPAEVDRGVAVVDPEERVAVGRQDLGQAVKLHRRMRAHDDLPWTGQRSVENAQLSFRREPARAVRGIDADSLPCQCVEVRRDIRRVVAVDADLLRPQALHGNEHQVRRRPGSQRQRARAAGRRHPRQRVIIREKGARRSADQLARQAQIEVRPRNHGRRLVHPHVPQHRRQSEEGVLRRVGAVDR